MLRILSPAHIPAPTESVTEARLYALSLGAQFEQLAGTTRHRFELTSRTVISDPTHRQSPPNEDFLQQIRELNLRSLLTRDPKELRAELDRLLYDDPEANAILNPSAIKLIADMAISLRRRLGSTDAASLRFFVEPDSPDSSLIAFSNWLGEPAIGRGHNETLPEGFGVTCTDHATLLRMGNLTLLSVSGPFNPNDLDTPLLMRPPLVDCLIISGMNVTAEQATLYLDCYSPLATLLTSASANLEQTLRTEGTVPYIVAPDHACTLTLRPQREELQLDILDEGQRPIASTVQQLQRQVRLKTTLPHHHPQKPSAQVVDFVITGELHPQSPRRQTAFEHATQVTKLPGAIASVVSQDSSNSPEQAHYDAAIPFAAEFISWMERHIHQAYRQEWTSGQIQDARETAYLRGLLAREPGSHFASRRREQILRESSEELDIWSMPSSDSQPIQVPVGSDEELVLLLPILQEQARQLDHDMQSVQRASAPAPFGEKLEDIADNIPQDSDGGTLVRQAYYELVQQWGQQRGLSDDFLSFLEIS